MPSAPEAIPSNADYRNAKRARHDIDGEHKVHIGDEVLSVPHRSTVQTALKDRPAVAARLDNHLVPLSEVIEGSEVQLEPVALTSPDGIRVLNETLKFLLTIAMHECSPALRLTVSKPFGQGYFCTVRRKEGDEVHMSTDEELGAVERCMKTLVEAAEPLHYMKVARTEAVEHFIARGAKLTADMLDGCMEAQVQCVSCRGLFHIPRSAMAINTSLVPCDSFKLTKFKEGFLLERLSLECKACSEEVKEMLYSEYSERRQWAHDVGLSSASQLNSAIRANSTKQIIQAVEANCDRQFVEIAAKVKARSEIKMILIAGPSSSGKTTFAKRLQVQLEALGLKPQVLSVDSYYKAWQDITSEGPQKVDWEALESLNLQQLNRHLLALLSGEEVLIPEYDMKTSMPMDKKHWQPMKLNSSGKGIIIMEGIHCLNPRLTIDVPGPQKFHIAIAPIPALQLDDMHVLSGTSIRMLRRMVRDYLNRGRPVLSTLRQWPAVAAGEVSNIFPFQANADAVMNSEIGYEMSVLKVHVEPLLRTISPTEPEYSEVHRLLSELGQFIAVPSGTIPPQSLLREFVGGSWYYDYGGWYKAY